MDHQSSDPFLRVGEFERTIADLKELVRAGFQMMHEEHGRTNGTLGKHELRLSRLEWRNGLVTNGTKVLTHLGSVFVGGILLTVAKWALKW
jgi:hypothetical protein